MCAKLFNQNAKVAILMGSKSDLEVVRPCLKVLQDFKIEAEVRIISAHRTPEAAHEFAANAESNGIQVIIGVAGKAAHLAGVLAAATILPVIALPVQTSFMGGLDSLLSMVQMPAGIPCATVGINAGENAALLAVQILAVGDKALRKDLVSYKKKMEEKIVADDLELQSGK